jgi:DNA polymerase III alpha subunit
MPDIDLDFPDRKQVLDIIKHIPAAIKDNGTFKKHNTGVYCHSIPYNPITDTASIDYKIADSRGYFKIDFLNVNVYKDIKDEEHLVRLLNTEPLWDLLLEDEFTNNLFHVNGHGSILRQMKPRNIGQLAAVLAMIRPAKRYLIGSDWATVMNEIWVKPTTDDYYFKKSHAHSYAALVVVHMNLLCENITSEHSLQAE